MSHPPLRAERSCDFDGFTDVIMHLLNAAWGEDWGTFCEAFPNGSDPSNVQLPVITYMLKEMSPGVINKDGVREIKPRLRGTFKQEENDDSPRVIDVYGRMLDCDVVFEIWEENNSKATKLANQFMDFLDMYTGYIKSQGVKEVIFQKYTNEMESGEWRDNIACRSLYYYVRLEHLNEVPTDVLEKVTGLVSAKANLSDDSIKEAIAFQLSE